MMTAPRTGQRVRLHYAASYAHMMPYHGRHGVVVVSGRGKPRNHAVRLDNGELVIVPCGNLCRVTGEGAI